MAVDFESVMEDVLLKLPVFNSLPLCAESLIINLWLDAVMVYPLLDLAMAESCLYDVFPEARGCGCSCFGLLCNLCCSIVRLCKDDAGCSLMRLQLSNVVGSYIGCCWMTAADEMLYSLSLLMDFCEMLCSIEAAPCFIPACCCDVAEVLKLVETSSVVLSCSLLLLEPPDAAVNFCKCCLCALTKQLTCSLFGPQCDMPLAAAGSYQGNVNQMHFLLSGYWPVAILPWAAVSGWSCPSMPVTFADNAVNWPWLA
ncbi:hypothetical protein Nepgr_033763 [Nepenthes gracilis]|uniref:Uncharacterized protein n=1 Tax=Nepenthes gracilis TaxID=150966 RepID=A0AAD3Y8V9_NEPGR|nr:hypothetical protein Nepgr_033763 [Nepenthes gracilis]